MKEIKLEIPLLLICVSFVFVNFGQKKNNFPQHILAYGLEEKNTCDYISSLLDDTNVVVFANNFSLFDFKLLKKDPNLFWLGEEPKCEKNIIELGDKIDRIYGFENVKQVSLFPDSYFKSENITKYNAIIKQLKIGDKLILDVLEESDSIFKMKVLDLFVKSFSLNKLDSLFLRNKMFRTDNLRNSELLKNKKIYVFHEKYRKGKLEPFLDLYRNENATIFISKKGSSNHGKGFYSFRNCLKRQENFSKLNFSNLPRKIKLTRKERVNRKELKGFKFIYINELDHCIW